MNEDEGRGGNNSYLNTQLSPNLLKHSLTNDTDAPAVILTPRLMNGEFTGWAGSGGSLM